MKHEDYEQTLRAAVYAAFLAQMVAGLGKGCEPTDQEMQHAHACASALLTQWNRVVMTR